MARHKDFPYYDFRCTEIDTSAYVTGDFRNGAARLDNVWHGEWLTQEELAKLAVDGMDDPECKGAVVASVENEDDKLIIGFSTPARAAGKNNLFAVAMSTAEAGVFAEAILSAIRLWKASNKK